MRPTPLDAKPPYQPLVPVAAAVLAGILAAEYVGGGLLVWAAAALVAAGAWLGLFLRRTEGRASWVPLLALVAAAAGARYRAAVMPPRDSLGRLLLAGPRLVILEGVAVQPPRQTPPPADVFLPQDPKRAGGAIPEAVRTSLLLACDRGCVGGHWHPARGRVVVSLTAAPRDDLDARPVRLGDRVQVVGVLRDLGRPLNPGGTDLAAHYRRQGVRAVLHTRHWEAVRVVQPGADRLRWAAGAIRRWADRRLDRIASREGRAVVAAIMFGRRDLLRPDTEPDPQRDVERAFLASGTAHFLAVSGLHVGLVAAAVLLLARLIGLGLRPTAVLVAAVVLAYALMTEMKAPVVRAAILVWILCLGRLLGRRPLSLNSLAAAVIVVLAVHPGDLFTAGFQLSFGVVLGIIVLAPRIERAVFRGDPEIERLTAPAGAWASVVRPVVRQTVSISLAASLVSIPLIAYRTHLVAYLAPVGSILLFPLVFALLASGLALVALGWLAPWLGDLLAAVPEGLALAVSGVVRALARVPAGHFYVSGFGWPWLLAAYAVLAIWVLRDRLRLTARRAALAGLGLAAAFLWTHTWRPPPHVRVSFLAVGNGNTNLIELPAGRAVLYDAGSALFYARAAEGAIAPAVWSRGIRRLDAAFLSHPHFDHFKDVLVLADRFGLRQVFVPPTFLRTRLQADDEVVRALFERGIAVEFFGAGDRLAGTGDAQVRAVWPRGRASWTASVNDGSLVLAVEEGGRRVLLTGDLEAAGIAALLGTGTDLRADALLWPHHGGDADAVGRLAAAAGARWVVVSARGRAARRPDPLWVGRQGAVCLWTGHDGMVTLDLRPERAACVAFAPPEAPAPQPPDLGLEPPPGADPDEPAP